MKIKLIPLIILSLTVSLAKAEDVNSIERLVVFQQTHASAATGSKYKCILQPTVSIFSEDFRSVRIENLSELNGEAVAQMRHHTNSIKECYNLALNLSRTLPQVIIRTDRSRAYSKYPAFVGVRWEYHNRFLDPYHGTVSAMSVEEFNVGYNPVWVYEGVEVRLRKR